MEDILDDEHINSEQSRRRDLLPLWIKIFTWIFLIMGFIIPAVFIIGILGGAADLAIYGLETQQPFSATGIFILLVFLIKGITAFGLWTEKDWAINIAIFDGVIGLVTCTILMFVLPNLFPSLGINFKVRIELFALIPYVTKIFQIKSEWEERTAG